MQSEQVLQCLEGSGKQNEQVLRCREAVPGPLGTHVGRPVKPLVPWARDMVICHQGLLQVACHWLCLICHQAIQVANAAWECLQL